MSAAASPVSLVIPRGYVGLLGIVPILIGGKKLFDRYRKCDRTEKSLEHHSDARNRLRKENDRGATERNGHVHGVGTAHLHLTNWTPSLNLLYREQ